jgi:hypothetical protein
MALALGLGSASADVRVSAQISHLVISVVDLTPTDSNAAGYEFLPIVELLGQVGVSGGLGISRNAQFDDRDTVAALAPRYVVDDSVLIDTGQARIANDGQPDLLRASAGSTFVGGLATSQDTGEYAFNLLPQTQLTFSVLASLTGDSLSGDQVSGDSGLALAQLSALFISGAPKVTQAIRLGGQGGTKSDNFAGTLSLTLSNPTDTKRNFVVVESFLQLEAAPVTAAMPEPSSAALMLAGLVCIGLATGRRFRP